MIFQRSNTMDHLDWWSNFKKKLYSTSIRKSIINKVNIQTAQVARAEERGKTWKGRRSNEQ